jgi:hypothetical protein
MIQIGRFFRMASAVFCIVTFMSFSALAAAPQPPFFGPANLPNTETGLVDVAGANVPAYPDNRTVGAGSIDLVSPWSACGNTTVSARADGTIPGKFNVFGSIGRTFTISRLDADGYYIGGDYLGWGIDRGHLELEKSVPGKSTYDQVHLWGQKNSGLVDARLSLVEQNGSIGVANIASLGVIGPCGAANANSQIWIPLGIGSNGQPTVIPDINGDGIPDPEFLEGPPMSGGAAPIPTLTEWGLIALTLILLFVGLRFSRKKEHFASA